MESNSQVREVKNCERENTKKQLDDLNISNDTISESFDSSKVETSLKAAIKAFEKDIENSSNTKILPEDIKVISGLFDISLIDAENTLKVNNGNLNKTIESLMLDFSEFQNSFKKFMRL
ncbi:hypothetical protein cand_038740 [Cryptosporidium andersoni]|uniref:Uncharacterized protein n=1 Tax=Cryptosporidium andersoni TaxID=117008 RepID=A0A1J4MBN5_9CRYT|nr:hypothetical protein cand_038740 [Cryptosporidium andersoni]